VLEILGLDTFVAGDLLVVLVLIILEGLLSCDNAVVLALLVKDLPPPLRAKALRYGIIGAYVFRITALCLAAWIMSKWYLKVAGGVYLLYLGLSHFLKKRGDADGHEAAAGQASLAARFKFLSPFWATVVAVELTDIVFSVDSIAAAVALSDKLWVLIAGGLLGILAMRFAAQGFVTLLARFPNLENAAFVAVAVIGLKLCLEMPADVVGLRQDPPPLASYATELQYRDLVHAHPVTLVELPHVLTINRAAAFPPDLVVMQAAAGHPVTGSSSAAALELAYRRANAHWNLHLRPLVEIEGWLSSLLVLAIFAVGFLRRASAKD
jgi:YkoY family integral membrane protein